MGRLPSIHIELLPPHPHGDRIFFGASNFRPLHFGMHLDINYTLISSLIVVYSSFQQQKYDQLRKSDSSVKKLSTAQKQEKYLEATSVVIQPVVESVRSIHPNKVWEDISPQFLVTFWSLAMYDLDVPNKIYEREI